MIGSLKGLLGRIHEVRLTDVTVNRLMWALRITTATLLIHSEGDLRCNVEQSEQVFTALQLQGIPSRLVRYPSSTSHGMSRKGPPDLRIHRLGEILSWWKKWLG